MRKGNHRLPAWLAGITALVATAGFTSAGAHDPNAMGNTGASDTQDCASASDRTSGACEHGQSAQATRDERDGTRARYDEEDPANTAQDREDDDRASSDESQTGSDRVARHSPDETPQTRQVPPAHATRMPGSSNMASTAATGQGSADSGSAGSNASDANSWNRQNDRNPQNVARAHESASSNEDEDTGYGADNDENESNRADSMANEQDSMANEQDEQSTRSVPPEHATRMPESYNSSSSSNTAENERASGTRNSNDYRNNPTESTQRSDTFARYGDERETSGARSATGMAAIQSRFDALDTDHDGTIDAAEAAVSTTLRAQFFTLDTNGDGKLSMSEFKGASDIASIRADRRERRQ